MQGKKNQKFMIGAYQFIPKNNKNPNFLIIEKAETKPKKPQIAKSRIRVSGRIKKT